MIVETASRKFYQVFPVTGGSEEPDKAMGHLWIGAEMTHIKKGIYREKLTRAGKKRWTYVVKATARVVAET